MPGRESALAVVIGDERDAITPALACALDHVGCEVVCLPSGRLAAQRVHVAADGAFVDGHPLAAVTFCTRPATNLSLGFAEQDADFCSAEARAAWLAVIHLPAVTTVNRWDPEVWYSASEWAIWRRRFGKAGVPQTPLVVGVPREGPDWTWLPWGGGGSVATPCPRACRALAPALAATDEVRVHVWCDGEVLEGLDIPVVQLAGAVLRRYGIRFATIATDRAQRVISCTTHLETPAYLASSVAQRLVEAIDEDLHCRRS